MYPGAIRDTGGVPRVLEQVMDVGRDLKTIGSVKFYVDDCNVVALCTVIRDNYGCDYKILGCGRKLPHGRAN